MVSARRLAFDGFQVKAASCRGTWSHVFATAHVIESLLRAGAMARRPGEQSMRSGCRDRIGRAARRLARLPA